MLDVMSGGRMEYAFPLGTGMEYWANEGTVNPTTARARFREGLDIILRSWSEDGPFRYDGEFYNYRYLNPWPKPFQQPRPKCFIVGTGSEETVSLAVDYDLGYSVVFVPIPNQLRAFGAAARAGRGEGPDDRPGRPDHRRDGIRRRDRRAGGARGAAAHREVLQLVPPRDAAVPRSARLRHDEGVPAPRLGRGAGQEHRGDLGRHGQHRPHRVRLAARPSPTRSSTGARRRASAA